MSRWQLDLLYSEAPGDAILPGEIQASMMRGTWSRQYAVALLGSREGDMQDITRMLRLRGKHRTVCLASDDAVVEGLRDDQEARAPVAPAVLAARLLLDLRPRAWGCRPSAVAALLSPRPVGMYGSNGGNEWVRWADALRDFTGEFAKARGLPCLCAALACEHPSGDDRFGDIAAVASVDHDHAAEFVFLARTSLQ